MSIQARKIINKWLPGERLQLDKLDLKVVPKIPDFVEEIDFSFNSSIIKINSLPSNLKKLTFQGYIAEELDISLPKLEYLDISHNTVKRIKHLPKSLKVLIMKDSKKLISLDNIPDTLEILDLSESFELELESFPDSIKQLEIENCNYEKLPKLPFGLEKLNCSRNKLTKLFKLPSSLTKLECDHNRLTSLEDLPSSLIKIKCSNNLLSSFPKLHNNIKSINISHNDIKVILTLPTNLFKLHCRDCNISILPTLPKTLEKLHCGDNQIASLSNLPDNLTELEIEGNPIYKIVQFPKNLEVLDISNCKFPALPNLPDTLVSLSCDGIPLSTGTFLPKMLKKLSINDTGIKKLPKLSNKIEYLSCKNNNLQKISSLPSQLAELDCSHNSLTSLPSLPYSLHTLNCSYNQISTFPYISSDFVSINVSHNFIDMISEFNYIVIDLNISYNRLTKVPIFNQYIERLDIGFNKIKSLGDLPKTIVYLQLEGNPIYDKVVPKLKNPSSESKILYDTRSFKNDNVNVITLPKGTVLFKGFKASVGDKLLSDYLGWYKKNDKYSYVWPNFNVFYYPYPFVVDDINLVGSDIIMTTNYLRNDVKVILGVSPSENARNDRHTSDYLKVCSKIKVSDHFEGLYYDPCLNPEFIKENPDITGAIFISGTDAKEHREITGQNVNYVKYRHFFQDNNNIIGVPEIVLHPFVERNSEEVRFDRDETTNYEWLSKNIDKYNYSTLSVNEHKAYSESEFKKLIDELLSPEGATLDGQVYHMTLDLETRFFVIAELADKKTLKHCIPISEKDKLKYLN